MTLSTYPDPQDVIEGPVLTVGWEHKLRLLQLRRSRAMGAGPALFGTETKIDNAIGFADVNGMHADATGAPLNFASSDWVWGGAVQIGLNYFLDRNWFVDFNYTYARSAKFKSNFSAPFASSSLGYDIYGTLFVAPSQRVTDQSVSVSINRRF
jgi:opacity protein-like surface antigen